MPSYTVTVGDRDYTVDAPDPRTAWSWANRYAAENPLPAPKTGLVDSGIASVKGALSRAQTGIESLVSDPNAATERGMRRGRKLDDEYQSQVSLDEIKRRYNEDGILSAAGEVLRQTPYALAEQAPRIAATAAAARTGAMLGGAAAGPVGALVGGIGGAAVPSAVEFFGGNLERQGETQQRAGQAVNVDRGDAALAAVPQAGLDAAATLVPLGRTYVGKLLGPAAEEFLKRGGTKVADEALWKVITKGGALSLGTEVPTEILQQVMERKQAGLPLTDDAAMAEYGQAAYGAALLSPLGSYGRYNDRSAAREQRTADARTKALADRKAAEEKTALETAEARKRTTAEQTGAPLLAGALPEGDEAVITGPQLPVVNPRDAEAAALLGEIESPEIARQYRLMRGQRDALNEQMMAAAAAGDAATVNKIRPQLAQLAQGVKNAEQRAAEEGINLAQIDPVLAQERAAEIEAEEKRVLRQLKKAGDEGDDAKVGKAADRLAALQQEKSSLQQPDASTPAEQQGGQMGLFGEENLDRIEAAEQTQQARMAEAEATVRQPAPALTREAEGNRDISEITADIATQPDDIRTLRTLGIPQEQRAEYEEAIDNGQITPLVSHYLGINSEADLDAEIKRLNALPRKEEIALTGQDGRLTPEALDTLQRDVRLEQLRRLRESMQPAKDDLLVEQLVGKVGEGAQARAGKAVVSAAPDLSPEQRQQRINKLQATQDRSLLALRRQIDMARDNKRVVGNATSLIAKSDRALAQQRMEAARDAYLQALAQQRAEERALQNKPGLTDQDMLASLPVKSVLDEMIQRSLAAPRWAVIDPLGVEEKQRARTSVANRPRQAKRYLREARQIHAQMRAIYIALQRGTNTKTLPGGRTVEVKMSEETRAKLRALDARLAKRLEELRAMFRGDPEYQTEVKKVLGRATTDPRPLTQRPLGNYEASIDALLEQLEDERSKLTSRAVDREALTAESARIDGILARMDDRSQMRIGQQAGTTQERTASARQRLEQRQAQIEQLLKSAPAPEKATPPAQRSLFPSDANVARAKANAERATPNERAVTLLDGLLDAADGRRTGLSAKDKEMLRAARGIIERQSKSDAGSSLARLVLSEFGDIDPRVMDDRLDRARLGIGTVRRGPLGRPVGKNAAVVGADANLRSSLDAVAAQVAAAQSVQRDDEGQGALFPKEQEKLVTQRANSRTFLRLVKLMVVKAADARAKAKQLVAKAAASANVAERTERDIQAAARRVALAKTTEAIDALNAVVARKLKRFASKYDGVIIDINDARNALQLIESMQRDIPELTKQRDEILKQREALEKTISDLRAKQETAPTSVKFAEGEQDVAGIETRRQLGAQLRRAQRELMLLNSRDLSAASRNLNQAQKILDDIRDPGVTDKELEARLGEIEKKRAAILAERDSAIDALDAELQQLYRAAPSTDQLAKSEQRAAEARSKAEGDAKVNRGRMAAQSMMERLAALPGKRITREAIYQRGGSRLEDADRPTKRVVTEVGGPRPRVGAQPLLATPDKVVYVQAPVRNKQGQSETQTIEVPVVAKVYYTGERAGQLRKRKNGSDWYVPKINLPPSLMKLVAEQVSKGEIKKQGDNPDAIAARRVVPVKARAVKDSTRAFAGLPGTGGEAGVAKQPPLRDLRTGIPAVDRRSGDVSFSDDISFRVGNKGGGIDAAQAKERAAAVKTKLPDGISFTYYASASALPEDVQKAIKAQGLDADTVRGGVTAKGRVFIVGDAHADMVDLERTIAHELRGHYGFEGFVGEVGMGRLLNQVNATHGAATTDSNPVTQTMYHGTPTGRVATSQGITFYTSDKAVAQQYADGTVAGTKRAKSADARVIETRITTQNTLDMRKKAHRDAYEMARQQWNSKHPDPDDKLPPLTSSGFISSKTGLPSYGQIANIMKAMPGFDSAFVDEGSQGTSLVVKNSWEGSSAPGVFGLADKLGVGDQARAAAQGVKMVGGDERAQQLQALKEIIAYTEEATVDKNLLGRAQQFIKEMVGAVRAALKRMGLVDASKLSTSDLFYLMRQSRKNFEAGLPLASVGADGAVSFRLGDAPKSKPAAGYEQEAAIIDRAVAENKSTFESLRGTVFDTLKLAARQKVVDARAGIEEAVTRALSGGVISDKTAGDVMYAVRTADHRSNWIAATVSEGAPQIVKDEKTGEWRIEIKPGASLKDMFAALNAEVGKMGNEQFVGAAFTTYMAAERDLNDLGGDKLLSITDAEKRQMVEMGRQNETFQEARRIYKEYNQNLLKFVASTGALSEKTVSGWLAKDYVPFYRENNGVVELLVGNEAPTRIGNLNEQPYLRALVGGDSKVKDVFTTALRNTSILMDMALRNTAARNTAFGFQEMGILAGKVSPETGKVRGINRGPGPARKDAIRFKLDGEEHHAIIDTSMSEALFGDIPPELLAQSLEGIVVQLPDFMRILGMPSGWVRTMVTRDPRYAFRQIIRDSLSSWVTSGGDAKPMVGTLRELTTMYNGKNATENFLKNSGVLGGQVLQGMNEDMAKIARMISAGGNNSRLSTLFAGLDALGVKADAATRVSLYNSYIRQGMSERQALLAVMDSTNFTKRGSSPFMYTLNTLIPFFNAQIVGLDVLYRAATGKASGAEKLRIKNKLIARGSMMAAMTMLYAAGMDDDEAYENATPQQRFGNWFVRIPGVAEPLRVPIPFEVGLLFKALPEAVAHAAGDDAKSAQAWGGLMDQAKQSVPGWSSMFLPQAIKPLVEIGFNKAAMNGIPVVNRRLEGLEKAEQFDERTPEILKWVGQYSSIVGLSPKQLEHLVGSYTTALGLALLRMPDAMVSGAGPAKPDQRLSEMPIVGPMFQPNDAGGILQLAFQQSEEAARAKQTFTALVMRGDTAAAERFLAEYGNKIVLASFGGKMQQAVGKINAMETLVRADPKLSPAQKRQQLAELRQLELTLARQATDLRRGIERQAARP